MKALLLACSLAVGMIPGIAAAQGMGPNYPGLQRAPNFGTTTVFGPNGQVISPADTLPPSTAPAGVPQYSPGANGSAPGTTPPADPDSNE